MQIKRELRKQIRAQRKSIADKSAKDSAISDILFKSSLYLDADTILCYVSLSEEISTYKIIERAFEDGKKVAVPYCTDDAGHMDFYYINSFDYLSSGSFNVPEPDISKCKKLEDFKNSIIIVPALCFDKKGYRLGYGKGYYDRFLQKYPFISIGLCYNSLIKNRIPTDEYDQSVDYIITESSMIDCTDGGENG